MDAAEKYLRKKLGDRRGFRDLIEELAIIDHYEEGNPWEEIVEELRTVLRHERVLGLRQAATVLRRLRRDKYATDELAGQALADFLKDPIRVIERKEREVERG